MAISFGIPEKKFPTKFQTSIEIKDTVDERSKLVVRTRSSKNFTTVIAHSTENITDFSATIIWWGRFLFVKTSHTSYDLVQCENVKL